MDIFEFFKIIIPTLLGAFLMWLYNQAQNKEKFKEHIYKEKISYFKYLSVISRDIVFEEISFLDFAKKRSEFDIFLTKTLTAETSKFYDVCSDKSNDIHARIKARSEFIAALAKELHLPALTEDISRTAMFGLAKNNTSDIVKK